MNYETAKLKFFIKGKVYETQGLVQKTMFKKSSFYFEVVVENDQELSDPLMNYSSLMIEYNNVQYNNMHIKNLSEVITNTFHLITLKIGK